MLERIIQQSESSIRRTFKWQLRTLTYTDAKLAKHNKIEHYLAFSAIMLKFSSGQIDWTIQLRNLWIGGLGMWG